MSYSRIVDAPGGKGLVFRRTAERPFQPTSVQARADKAFEAARARARHALSADTATARSSTTSRSSQRRGSTATWGTHLRRSVDATRTSSTAARRRRGQDSGVPHWRRSWRIGARGRRDPASLSHVGRMMGRSSKPVRSCSPRLVGSTPAPLRRKTAAPLRVSTLPRPHCVSDAFPSPSVAIRLDSRPLRPSRVPHPPPG